MDYVIIKTGFASITHNIIFQKQITQPKGKYLAEAGHVRDVAEYRSQSISYLIQANVIRQVNLGETLYAVKLNINGVRMVVGVSCTCVYNKSEKCKHIAALIYYINNHRSLSKTSFEQQWGNPTARQYVQEKYSKGCSFALMFPPPQKPHVDPLPIDMSKLIGPSPLKSILLVDETAHEKRMKQKLDKSKKEAAENYEKCTKFVKIMLELREIHYTYGRNLSVEEELMKFYEKSIVLRSADEIIKLCADTLQQSKSDTWYAARRLRISASTNVHSIKTRKTKSIEALVQELLYPKKVDTTATRYGKENGKVARKQYELLYGVSVQQVGLVISEEQQWLCASPDGVVIEDDFIAKLFEAKCPYSCVKLPIVDYEARKCNVSYLKLNDDDTVSLKMDLVV